MFHAQALRCGNDLTDIEHLAAGELNSIAQFSVIDALEYTVRLRTFKRSHEPTFAAKVENGDPIEPVRWDPRVVRLYMDPPAAAVVLSIDEKNQI